MSLEMEAVRNAINRAAAFRRGELHYLHCPELQVYDDLLWRWWDETRRANGLTDGHEGSLGKASREDAVGQVRKTPAVGEALTAGAVPINYRQEPPR